MGELRRARVGVARASLVRSLLRLWSAAAASRSATIVERVVAVIGERPVLWTELLHRALAGRVQIRMQTHDPNVISVQEQEMYKELLDRMIDDRLEEQQADKAHITVTPEEIDRGIANIAAQAQAQQGRPVTVADVLGEVRRRGLTEQDFREEIRRQILEGKLIELRVRPRVRVTEQDAHAAYQHWVQEMHDQQPVDVRILALRVPGALAAGSGRRAHGAGAGAVASARARAKTSASSSSQYSDDVSTKRQLRLARAAADRERSCPPIQEAVRTMQAGIRSRTRSPLTVGQEEVHRHPSCRSGRRTCRRTTT